MFDIAAIWLVITALMAYVNHRYVGLPTTIGAMVTALALSIALVGLDAIGLAHGVRAYEEALLLLAWAGLDMPLIRCLVFGALILPKKLALGHRRRVAFQRWRGRRDLLPARRRADQR